MSLTAANASVAAAGAATLSSAASSSSGSGNGNNNNNLPFEKDKIWYFSNEQLGNSPSRRCGIKSDDELHYRQMTAYLIQEMGQRLQVSQLCINTAIVYMHRFYAFHSFTHFHRNSMASASLFLAAKVEEQPRKLEHVIRAANKCLPQTTDQSYADLAQELVFNENVLLQTLGFDVAIDHPHTHVVRTCQLVKACKDLAQTSYFLASNSLHLTSMCLQYRPTVVACFCIYLACKWSRWEIPQSTEGKHWFYYVDKSVSLELLKQLTDEFIAIYEKSPARLKSKLNSIKAIAQGAGNRTSSSKDNKPKEDWKMSEMMKGYHSNITAPPELMNGSDSRDQSSSSSASQAALLPPPAMVPPQQRRNDGSHQRSSSVGASGNSSTSSNSSSSASSTSNHKLPNYPGALLTDAHGDHKSKPAGYSSRAPSSSSSASATQRGSSSSNSSSSNSSSSASSQQRGSSSQPSGRPPMPMDYHKSSRGMPPVGLPPHGAHKLSSAAKPNQMQANAGNATTVGSTKELSKSSGNKLYPNAPPAYGNSAATNPLMSRAGYQGSNTNVAAVNSSNGAVPPVATSAASTAPYGSHRNKSVASSSSTSSSSTSSVHNLPPYEQQLNYGQNPSYNLESQQQQQKNNSLFSPEWSDIKKEPHFNGLLPPPPPESLSYKLNNHTRERDSPKKERLTPTKKDKHRSSSSSSSSSSTMPHSATGTVATTKSMLPPHKSNPNELAGGGAAAAVGSLKRANEISGSQYGLNKLDEHDGSLPRDKMRKLDNSVGLPIPNYANYEDKHAPLSMSNGIETTPDLVRSLLKESLCTTNASLLKPDALTMPGLKPPAELLEPMPTTNIKKESMLELDALTKLEDGSIKSEKKKKKDKHKHKEKDKSKDKPDKEERKKHKKDKQKERKDTSMDSLKLVIKTNTAATATNPNGSLQVGAAAPLKLKISKNKVEPNNYSAAGGGMPGFGLPAVAAVPTTVLPPYAAAPGYTNNNNSSSSGSSSSSSKKKHSDRERDKESKKSKSQDYAKYNGVAGSGIAGGVGGGVAYAALGGAGTASMTQANQVSSLLGLPATMTTASSAGNALLMTSAMPAAAPPSALPIYNKK